MPYYRRIQCLMAAVKFAAGYYIRALKLPVVIVVIADLEFDLAMSPQGCDRCKGCDDSADCPPHLPVLPPRWIGW